MTTKEPGRAGAEIASWHKLHAAMGKYCAVAAVPGRIEKYFRRHAKLSFGGATRNPGPRRARPAFRFRKRIPTRAAAHTVYLLTTPAAGRDNGLRLARARRVVPANFRERNNCARDYYGTAAESGALF